MGKSGYSFGRGDKYDSNKINNPGPGQYSIKNIKENQIGWSVGKEKRPKLGYSKNNFNNGPGSYDLQRGIVGGNRFGVSDRPGNINVKTPGFYKVPASVPDVPKYLYKYDGCMTKY